MNNKNEDYKDQILNNIEKLKIDIKSTQDELNFDPSDFFPSNSGVKLELNIIEHDYEADLKKIEEESKLTLECLANLYLDENIMANKNINNIIINNSMALSDLKFSIACSKRGLINLMKQIDNGSVSADLYQSVSLFQREMKEGIDMLYKLQKNIKDLFKDIKNELKEINVGDSSEQKNILENMKIVGKDINKSIEEILNRNKQ